MAVNLCGETLPEPGSFAAKVQALDAALTGKDVVTVARGWRRQTKYHDSLNWYSASDAYYLSDGGYSRILYSELHECLCLSGVSRQEVKDRWSFCKELVADIEAAIRGALADYVASGGR